MSDQNEPARWSRPGGNEPPPTPPVGPTVPVPTYGAPALPVPTMGGPYGAPVAPVPPYAAPPAPLPSSNPPKPGADGSTNVLAIVSFVSSFFISVVAIITGHIALRQIRRTAEKGRGFAIAGLAIGYAGVVAGFVIIVIIITGFIVALVASTTSAAEDPGTGIPDLNPFATSAPGSGGDDLTFDAGQTLQAGTIPQISDGLLGAAGWTANTPKTGEGIWTYVSTDNTCRTTFSQGALDPSVAIVAGDDRATTENYLAFITQTDASDVRANAFDDYLGLGQPDANAIVDTLILDASDDSGKSSVTSARAFSALGQGVFVDVTCVAGTDVYDAFTDVVNKTGVLVN